MRFYWENPFFTIPVLLFLAAGFGIALYVPYSHEILFFNDWRVEPLNGFFRFCTMLGEDKAYYVFAMTALLMRRYRFAILIAATGLSVLPIAYILKDQIGVDRPVTYFDRMGRSDELVLVPSVEMAVGQTSFPSGHTMSAFALYALLAMMAPKNKQWLAVLCAYTAMLVGISRVFLAQHFLVDILGGALMGLGLAWAVYWAQGRWWRGK